MIDTAQFPENQVSSVPTFPSQNGGNTQASTPDSTTPEPVEPPRSNHLMGSFIAVFCLVLIGVAGYFFLKEKKAAVTEQAQTNATDQVEIVFYGQPRGVQHDSDQVYIDEFTKKTGIKVKYIPRAESVTEALAFYKQKLNAQADDLDVFLIDVIWPGLLSEHLENLTPEFGSKMDGHFQAIVQNNTVNGKLVGIPFYTDAGLLFYRKDLLEKYGYKNPPTTWNELETMAKKIQAGERKKNPNFWGYVWQGAEYEGLTCNALEWQASHGGGEIISAEKQVAVNNKNMAKALKRAQGWIGTISPTGVINYQEEDARGIWQAGNASFMRNWPYGYALGQKSDSPIKDLFGVTLLPEETKHASTLGGWQLAVSKYSKHKKEAKMLVEYLSSREIQKRRSIEGAYLPTIADLYDDSEVLAVNPYYHELKPVFAGGTVARPSARAGAKYPEVSAAYFQSVHKILSKKVEINQELVNLEKQLTTITGFPSENSK